MLNMNSVQRIEWYRSLVAEPYAKLASYIFCDLHCLLNFLSSIVVILPFMQKESRTFRNLHLLKDFVVLN